MSTSNPLRPYYDHDTFNAGYSVIFKPGVGLIDTETNKPISASLASSVANNTSSGSRSFASGNGIGLSGLSNKKTIGDISSMTGEGDKNYVYDLEFQEYFDFNNLSELVKNLMWNFFKNYCKVLFTQPLEIVRLVLQVGYFNFDNVKDSENNISKANSSLKSGSKKYTRLFNDNLESSTPQITDISDSESDSEINYFQSFNESAIKSTPTLKDSNSKSPAKITSPTTGSRNYGKDINKIHPISKHTIDIMTAIASKDGPFALFRGINAQFIHQTLSHTIEAWITGFISPFIGIPDPFFLDLTHLTDPLRSLWLSVLACVLTGLILMPLDLIKVRLMITQFNKSRIPEIPSTPPSSSSSQNIKEDISDTVEDSVSSVQASRKINTRSIRDSIRNYPLSLIINPPPTIALLTILHQFSTSVFRKTAPYLMHIRFNLDTYLSPNLYTLLNLLLLIMEFFIKLPVENLLRKEQVRFLLKPKSSIEDEMRVVTIDNPAQDLIVNFNSFDIHDDLSEENLGIERPQLQGLFGFLERIKRLHLFNGWRVGVLNVIGFWGYNIFKTNSAGLKQEKL